MLLKCPKGSYHSSFDLQGGFCMHVWSGQSPNFKNEKYVVWAAPNLLSWLSYSSSLGVMIHREWISNCFIREGAHVTSLPCLKMRVRRRWTCRQRGGRCMSWEWGGMVDMHPHTHCSITLVCSGFCPSKWALPSEIILMIYWLVVSFAKMLVVWTDGASCCFRI